MSRPKLLQPRTESLMIRLTPEELGALDELYKFLQEQGRPGTRARVLRDALLEMSRSPLA